MTFMTKLASKMLNLPRATHTNLEYQIDIQVPMPDGVVLMANRVAPRGGENLPIILLRDPYSSRGTKPDFMSLLIAERGYQVVVQNCRGTWGSEGEFRPFRDDREDGLATLRWLANQSWFSGSVGMFGLSYWGYAQLAAGPDAPEYLKALVPMMSASRIYGVFRPHGLLALNVALTWHYQTYVSNAQKTARDKKRANAKLNDAVGNGYRRLPISEADQAALGFTADFYQSIIRNDQPDDPFWAEVDHSQLVKIIEAPVHLVGGWYDFFLADQLVDYINLYQAGKKPYLTIGPWTHVSTDGLKQGLQESFIWYDAHLRGNINALRSLPVRICVMGINKWIDLPAWPPAFTAKKWYLQQGGGLSPSDPLAGAEASRYTYDPADPTPSIGGRVVVDGGPKDNRKLESRKDILTFTSELLTSDITIVGPVSALLHVRSTAVSADFYVRLCDVQGQHGKSVNICEGMVRLSPDVKQTSADGISLVKIDLSSTAHCFKAGHRVRIQVSSGAHPLFMRNLGTGESMVTGTKIQVAEQEIFHDLFHPSAVILPIY
jgi:putative CocE/NonD family hydrolase